MEPNPYRSPQHAPAPIGKQTSERGYRGPAYVWFIGIIIFWLIGICAAVLWVGIQVFLPLADNHP
jgi:hypothetical protein